jgi:Ni/Fe-hydrogenase 1 B-type cytochrome subunit
MAQNEIIAGTAPSHFMQKHSVQIRIWHWLFFFLISSSMITILLVSTFLKPQQSSGVLQGLSNQANQIAFQYEERMLTIHKLIGFGLAFLLLSRILIEITHSAEEKISTRIRNAIGLYKKKDENKIDYRHYIAVKLSYTLFYILISIMAITGIGLALGRQVPFLGQLHQSIITVHRFVQYFIYAFVFIHLSGLVIADNSNAKGIISGMINGNK